MLGVRSGFLLILYRVADMNVFQIAVSTIKYLVELRGWNGIALPAVHSRDAKIYLEDPGPWILGLATEARYLARTAPEVCICDL
jgi:EEF1A N-terminal glycine/lysine methyltransferase